MSLITYILESCDGTLRYRVNFTGATYLDVGETWNVECDGIPNGCYNVLENTGEILDEYNGDECLFVEFENCEDCESSVDSLSAGPTTEPCYIWLPCNGGSAIYVPTAYDNYDYFQYVNTCYYNTYSVSNTVPTTTSIGATQWRLSCEICNDYIGVTDVDCYEYAPCPDNVRPFTVENAIPTLSQTNIFYPTTESWAGSDTIYFQNTETGENRCFYLSNNGIKGRWPTINVEAITGNTSPTSSPVDGCSACSTVCDSQDIVIFIDNYCCQSGNPLDAVDLVSFFNASVAGAKKYVESLEDDINSGIVQVAIYRKPSGSCSTSGLVIDLTDNYSNIINALDNLTFQNGPLDRAENFFDIYDVLTTGYFREGATATLLWLADSFYSHIGGECWPPSPFNSWWNPKEHYAGIMKMGWINGPFGKPIRIQIVEFDSELYPWPATESSASSPDDYMLTTHADWSATTWANINPLCEDFVSPGDDFDIYQARPCCDGPELYVSLDTGTTVSLGNDGFNYQGFCYYLQTTVPDSYSAYTSINLLSGDVVTNICSSTSNPDCSCGKIEVRKFISCCDPTDNITVAFDTAVAGNVASGDGIIFSGNCYEWDGGPTQTVTYSDAITTEFISDICTTYCIDDFCSSNTPTPTPTPTITVTPTLTITPTVTPTLPLDISDIWSGCSTGNLYKLFDTNTSSLIEGIVGYTSGFTTTGPVYGSTLEDNCLTAVEGFDTSNIVYSTFSTTGFSSCEVCQKTLNYTSYRVVYSGCCYGEQGTSSYSFNDSLTLTPGYSFYDGVECRTIISTTLTSETGLQQIDTLYENCSGCTDVNSCTVSGCGQQDIVILIDQSGSIDNTEWEVFVDGVVAIATGLEGNMNSGDVKVGALKWSYCSNVNLVSDLTTNYTNFVSAVNSANNDGGGTYVGQALIDAYNMLVGGSSTPGAEKNIVLLTDGGIGDFNNNCTTTSDSASQLATQMKTGTYGSGQVIKITTVGIGSNAQSSQLSSLSSGPDFQYLTSGFEDFAENISSQISITSCDETEDPGIEFDYYSASACCESYGLQNIIVQASTATTVTLGTDGFSWNGNCYTFENSVDSETYSGQSVHFVSESLLLSNVCSDTVNCRSCGTYQKTYLRNCCIDYDKIQILYSGTPINGEGIEYNGFCYVYTGDTTGTDVGLTYDTLVEDLCISGDCDCRSISPTPTPTVTTTSTPTITPTTTITPTPTATISITPSITNTVTPSATFGLSNTPTPTVTPTLSITPTLTPSITVSPTPSPTRGTALWLSENCCDNTDTLNVSLPTQTTKVFVFYDGTSLDVTKAEQASENIRAWYQDKVDGGDLSEGNLYEGFIGETSDNGENWLWWASYPYLGSLSGGVLSDSTVISEFNTAVDDSIYNSSFCKSSVGGCVPNNTEFNDGEDIYRRINRGYQLTGSYGVDDLRSNGVPFNHSLLTSSSTSGNGTFDGGISDYIVILVADESDGAVGFYHGKGTKDTLTTQGFNLYNTDIAVPQYYLSTAGSQPTNRFVHDYESYLQVWNDIQTVSGRINSIVYPVVDDNNGRIPFPLHCVGAIEGETINATNFQTKYGEPITSVGPENLNLSLITTQNPYSTLSSNSVYTGLPLSYQNGPGLKNFGIQVDPTVEDFTLGSITDTLDSFLDSLDVTNGYGFGYGGNCYFFVGQTTGVEDLELKWSQVEEDYCNTAACICASNTPTVTPSLTVTPTPSPTNLPSCVSGTTDGSYRYTDCCGIEQIGTSLGQVVCVDTTLTYFGVNLTYLECTVNCDQGPLQVNTSLTGACEGQGVISVNVQKGTPPYFVENTTTGEIQSGYGPNFVFDGLSEGLYNIYVYDSTTPNRTYNASYQIQPCFDAIISDYTNATCGQSNGTITISGNSTTTIPYDVSLYVDGNSTPFLETTIENTVQQFSTNINPGYSYYAIVTNSQGVSAQTQNVTITTTSSVEFGISYTNTSQCGGCSGTAEVTGLTGTPPYTYVWGNGQTNYIATGLCEGITTVVVTDNNGCSNSSSVTIGKVDSLGISGYNGIQPNCFDCDGEITIQVTGGTAPYTFVGSNTQTETNSDGEFTLSGLCGGQYGITITDSNNCTLQQDYTLNSSSGINSVTVTPTDSTCGGNGSIKIDVVAIVGSLTYSITGNTNGYTETQTTNNQTYTFTNLDADTYTVKVSSSNGCDYTTTSTINDEEKFTLSVIPSNASCGSPNGSATINVLSGTSEIFYPLSYLVSRVSDGLVVYSSVGSTFSSEGVSNLSDGTYEVNVTDNQGCTATDFFSIIQEGSGVQAILYSTNCVLGNDGTATIEITQGQPPFNITWSSNVPLSQRSELEISGLSGGTYLAQIIDSNGCEIIKSTTINCDSENVDNYVINTICEQDFITNSQGKRGFYEMLNEAFLDLNQPGKDCELVSASFTGVLVISGGSYGSNAGYANTFYTTTDLNDVPSDNLWESVVQGLLSNYAGITYTTDILNNVFTIKGDCDGDQDPTNGAYVNLSIEIDLDVDCESTGVPPSPTPTSTVTPTISLTPSITPTISITPSVTSTVTPTISVSPTPGASVTTTPTVTPTITISPTNTITPTISTTPSPTPSPTMAQEKALLFILEQSNNLAFATYMNNNGSTFYGFGYNIQPSNGTDITLFMDWSGWFDGTAPTVIEQTIPQSSGGSDTYGNTIEQYKFLTTQVPQGTATDAWYIWLIPQSLIGSTSNRQLSIGYNINSSPNSLIYQSMTSSIYAHEGVYTGVNWENGSYRMYTTHPGSAFSISNNNTDDLYFRGGNVG